jgi:hypothetical protein
MPQKNMTELNQMMRFIESDFSLNEKFNNQFEKIQTKNQSIQKKETAKSIKELDDKDAQMNNKLNDFYQDSNRFVNKNKSTDDHLYQTNSDTPFVDTNHFQNNKGYYPNTNPNINPNTNTNINPNTNPNINPNIDNEIYQKSIEAKDDINKKMDSFLFDKSISQHNNINVNMIDYNNNVIIKSNPSDLDTTNDDYNNVNCQINTRKLKNRNLNNQRLNELSPLGKTMTLPSNIYEGNSNFFKEKKYIQKNYKELANEKLQLLKSLPNTSSLPIVSRQNKLNSNSSKTNPKNTKTNPNFTNNVMSNFPMNTRNN